MLRPSFLRFAALLAASVALPRTAAADVTPPPRASITLELTVDGQASVSNLRFFVTNCDPSPDASVLDPGAPLVCHPVPRMPVRVFGFASESMPELLELVRRDAGRSESEAFMAKAKMCGSVMEEDLVFSPDTGVALVSARYEISPGPKGGCRLKRVSATTKKASELPAVGPSASPSAPAASARPAAPAASGAAAPASGGCGCDVGETGARASVIFALGAFALVVARRRGPRRTG